MKKTIRFVLIALLTMIATQVHAQLGVQVGYNYTHSKGNLALGADNHFSGTSRNNGFQAGLTYDFTIVGNFGMQTALLYTFTGGTTKEENRRVGGYLGTQKTSSIYQFVDLPIRFAYALPVTNDFKFFVFAGPVLSYAFSGKVTGWEMVNLNTANKDESYSIYDQYEISPFELKVGGGLGVHYKHFQLKAGYDWGVLNLYPQGTKSTKLRRNQLSVSIGYVF